MCLNDVVAHRSNTYQRPSGDGGRRGIGCRLVCVQQLGVVTEDECDGCRDGAVHGWADRQKDRWTDGMIAVFFLCAKSG